MLSKVSPSKPDLSGGIKQSDINCTWLPTINSYFALNSTTSLSMPVFVDGLRIQINRLFMTL